MSEPAGRASVRLAELVATLSLGTDLGLGQPMEHVLRQCLIALRLSERIGFDDAQRRVVYYSGLLAWVGCFSDAYEQAKWFGDDIAVKDDSFAMDGGSIGYLINHRGLGRSLPERVRLTVAFLTEGRRDLVRMLENDYLATDELAARLGHGDGNHVDHVYAKIGISNRACAALFAMTHGVMSDLDLERHA